MSDPRWPDDGPNWPEHDLRQPEDEEGSGTDAPPPSGDELEPASDPPAPEESPAERPWDEPRWDAPRWDDSPWQEPTWPATRRDEPGAGADASSPEAPAPDEGPPPAEGYEAEPRGEEASRDEPLQQWWRPEERQPPATLPEEPRFGASRSGEPRSEELPGAGFPGADLEATNENAADSGVEEEQDDRWQPVPDDAQAPADDGWPASADVVADEPSVPAEAAEPAEPEPWAPVEPEPPPEPAEPWAHVEPEPPPEPAEPWAHVEPEPPSEPAEPWAPVEPEPPSEPAEPWAPVESEPLASAEEPILASAEEPILASAEARTAFGDGDDADWDPRLHGERRRPTTAEQAVPWMIGIILALAGMVIVLLALIFTFPGGLAGDASPSPTASPLPSVAVSAAASGSVEPTPSVEAGTPTPEPTQGPTPTAVPEYGPLEMVYMGRPSALAPIYLLDRDFSVDADPTILAQAEQGVARFAWSPDGRVGAAIIAGRAVALTPGASARALAEDISALTFGWDSETLYAVRVTRDGANDRTEILQIDFVTGAVQTLATITYPHPVTAPDPALREAQFIDDGGLVRLYAVADGNLTLWVLGAPATYRIDPGDGRVSNLTREPILWAPDGRQRIALNENANGTTLIVLRDSNGDSKATVQVTGLVSHIRWAGSNNEIVFTLGRLGASGGVRQDLYVWDLADGKAPLPLTSNGISFGAEWRGVMPNWLP